MGIIKRKVNGKWRYGVSRRLPRNKLGMKRFRRWYENRTMAQDVFDRLSGAIASGTLDTVLPGLVGALEATATVSSFWERFRDEYCKPRLSSWSRYELSFRTLNAEFGTIPLGEFRRQDLHSYMQKRKGQVSDSTINKDIAAIKKMFSYALEVGAVEHHPLVRFPGIRVQEKALRLPTVEEYHRLVDAMPDPVISAFVAVLGETGFRKNEALNLRRDQVDWKAARILTEKTKGKKVRSIPLSNFAMEKLRSLVPFVRNPHLFVHQGQVRLDGRRWLNPDKIFRRGRKAAGLEWITFHTLRHMRATTWMTHGVDLRTVKELLGHSDIRTTMRYVKYVDSHADLAVRSAQAEEEIELQNDKRGDKSGTSDE
jgi:integrase